MANTHREPNNAPRIEWIAHDWERNKQQQKECWNLQYRINPIFEPYFYTIYGDGVVEKSTNYSPYWNWNGKKSCLGVGAHISIVLLFLHSQPVSSLIPSCLFSIFSQLLYEPKDCRLTRVLFQFHSIIYYNYTIETSLAISTAEENDGEREKKNYRSLIKIGTANNTLEAPYNRNEFFEQTNIIYTFCEMKLHNSRALRWHNLRL